ncbi:MAG: cryptochrome/photolyase family protein [Elusimicrobiota bacterium]
MCCPTLVWFKNDLRLENNPALFAALAQGEPIIPVFIWSPNEESPWMPGSASRWWLHHSLTALHTSLLHHGSQLIIRQGKALPVIIELLKETGAKSVYWNRRYEPALIKRDSEIKSTLKEMGVKAESFNGSLIFEPWEILTQEKNPYQVFTAFWNTCLKQFRPRKPTKIPLTFPRLDKTPKSDSIDHLKLLPEVKWDAGFLSHWEPGERGAQKNIKKFVSDILSEYPDSRNRPDYLGTSHLSPHLHFGEISPYEIWQKVQEVSFKKGKSGSIKGAEVYLKEIGWREFAYHLLFHFPHTDKQPLREKFSKFPWEKNSLFLKKWQKGKTGYPIVDAGLRELWATGWMHNRVRMIVASFLVKDLLINWVKGAEWFWDTLVDADLASNSLGWQWTAGCGADAAPYFRIFNPILQGKKFDPNGEYVRRWVPELSKLPNKWIHQPWEAPETLLKDSGIFLGKNYPAPLVNHAEARTKALRSFQFLKTH